MRVIRIRVLLRQRHVDQYQRIGLAAHPRGQERTRLQAERGRSIRRRSVTVRVFLSVSVFQIFALQTQNFAMKE